MQSVHRRPLIAIGIIGTTLAACALAAPASAATATTTLVSVSENGVQGDRPSSRPSISADGRFVAFASASDTLSGLDQPGPEEILVKDTRTGSVQRLTVPISGDEADGDSFWPRISADGRFVTYASYAGNLVAGDTNNDADVFVYDRIRGGTTRVSTGLNGVGGGGNPSISADGGLVAFSSGASDIVAGDTNNSTDVFVWNRSTHKTVRASVGPHGVQSDTPAPGAPHQGGRRDNEQPMISADGSTVTFTSYATNLVPGDTNARGDVFVRDLRTNVTSRVSLKAGGGQSEAGGIVGDVGSFEPSISANGQVVAFGSYETDLTTTTPVSARNWYVYNRVTHRTVFAESTVIGGPGTLGASAGEIAPDGVNVVFISADSDVVAGDTNGLQDVFIRSLSSRASKLVSVNTDGTQSNDYSYTGTAAPGGKSVAFVSAASTLVSGDTNGQADVFLRRF